MNNDQQIEVIFGVINVSLDSVNDKLKSIDKLSNHTQLSKVITDVNKTIERFKKYAKPNWFRRMTTSDSVINANMILCEYEFKSFLRKGDELRTSIMSDVKLIEESIEYCHQTIEELTNAQTKLQSMIDSGQDEHGRIGRKFNDITSAIVMTQQTIAQMKLSLNNVYMIHDKFESVDSILRPVLERNISLSKGNNRITLLTHL